MKVLRFPRISVSFILIVFLFLFRCDPAQSKNVPGEFSRSDFNEIVKFSLNHYIDPGSVNVSRAYVGAAEASLATLPSPLMIYPRSFFERREQILDPDRVIPGKKLEIDPSAPYVLFVPDYVALDKKNDEIEKREKLKKKHLTNQDRAREEERIHEQRTKEKEELDSAWDRVDFMYSDFNRVMGWIEKNYQNYSKLPPTFKGEDPYKDTPFGLNLVYFNAINGFLQTMDPHSSVLDPHAWEKIKEESEDSTFEGIGAMLRGGGNQDVIVETPLANSPALKAGLRAGDIIRKVNGESIEGMNLQEVVKRIRGKRDTVVTLEVARPPIMSLHEIPIKRGVIEQKGVTADYLPAQKVGVIRVASFLYKGNETSQVIAEEYNKLMQQSNGQLKGIVLDLRNNPGGYLDEAINVAGLFLDQGLVVVQTKGRDTGLIPHKNRFKPIDPKTPMIVLINAGSASASEIVASALQDHERALILGERSFGKATVQEMQPRGRIIVKLTTARYYAPRGYTIQVYGVVPDVKISDEDDGSFPFRFREEDMWRHLPELKKREPDQARKAWVEKLETYVKTHSHAEEFLKKHKGDARRPDYMLQRALPYFDAMNKFSGP